VIVVACMNLLKYHCMYRSRLTTMRSICSIGIRKACAHYPAKVLLKVFHAVLCELITSLC
jgi:hypothetical protein